jgi:hypothetical protein
MEIVVVVFYHVDVFDVLLIMIKYKHMRAVHSSRRTPGRNAVSGGDGHDQYVPKTACSCMHMLQLALRELEY